jgi:thiamine transport system substrate-binding protein
MKKILYVIVFLTLLVSACSPVPTVNPSSTATPGVPSSAPTELNVMSHDSFAVTETLVRQFEQQNNVKINFLKSGDSGAMLNRAILTKNAPQADVMYGVDNTFLSRALDAGLFEAYVSPLLKNIPDAVKLDKENRALPVDIGDVCINYDKTYFADKKLALPQSLEDLLKPEYKGLLVVENPATSSPGLAFVMATIAHFGQDKYLEYWKGLRANGVFVANDWESAYYTYFSGSSGKGAQPMVVSYSSSPAAEVVFAKEPPKDAPTASLTAPDMCFRQIEFAGILKGTKNRAMAEKFVDFMLGTEFQEDMPLQMFVYPVATNAKLPSEFLKYAQVPAKPATLDAALIAKNRDQWIADWKKAVLD